MATLPMNSPAVDLAGKIAGGALGGIIGSFLGPLGTVAGRAIGSKLGQIAARAAAATISEMMEDANEDAEEETKEEEAEKVCADCGEIDCFEPPEGVDREEFERQLREQQDEINNMDPDDLLNNLDDFATNGRPAGDAAARRAARASWLRSRTRELSQQFRSQGMSPAEAAKWARAQAGSEMTGLDATHTVDGVAGGDGTISGLGNRTANRSIGSQWKGRRSQQLREAIEEAKRQGKKPGVKLEVCPDESGGAKPQDGSNSPGNAKPGSGPPPTS